MEETNQEINERHKEEAISIAVITTQLCDFKELMLEKLSKQDIVLGNIENQTIKTNGSVVKTITDIKGLEGWRNKIVGGLTISNIIIVPLLMWLISQHLES